MPMSAIEAHVDSDLKTAAERVLAEARLSVSEVVEGVLKKIVAEGYVSLDLFHPNAETLAAMEEARRGGLRSFATVEELMADLHAED